MHKALINSYRKLFFVAIILVITVSNITCSYASDISEEPGAEAGNEPNEELEAEEKELKSFSGGEGTKKKPFLISSKKDLLEFSEVLSEKDSRYREYHYKLTKDINLGSTKWSPMGHEFESFSGVFDGDGHKITIKRITKGNNQGNNIGLFSILDRSGTIKNLTVKSAINLKISSKENLSFGLIAGRSEGIIKNCTTEGTIKLTVSAKQDICIGAVVGLASGDIHNIENNASITVNKTGTFNIFCGGIVGAMRGFEASLSYITNNGTIAVTTEGKASVGGILGDYNQGKKLYSALNNGNISLYVSKLIIKDRAIIGGIAGTTVEGTIDRAVNKKKIYIEYTSKPDDDEIIAGGIIGESRDCRLINVGNEGRVECKSGRAGIAAGIIGMADTKDSIYNAYNSGTIYTSTIYTRTKGNDNCDVYSHGLIGGIAEVKNFYNSGKVTQKAGSRKEVNGEGFANIRPGENTKSFNYSYWDKATEPFPPTNYGTSTTSSFNEISGKLTKSISIGSRKFSDVTSALNAWINTQKDKKSYVKWTGKGTPKFAESFGYVKDANIK